MVIVADNSQPGPLRGESYTRWSGPAGPGALLSGRRSPVGGIFGDVVVAGALSSLEADPTIIKAPPQKGLEAGDAHNRYGTNPLLKDAYKAGNEYYDGTDMLNDDSRVGDQRPELVGLEAWIAL